MTRVLLTLAAVAVLVAGAIALRTRAGHHPQWDAVAVTRSDVVARLQEPAELAPHASVMVKAPFAGRISFLVDDGTWVERGQTVLVLSAEEELQRLAQDRAELIGARQDLRLARLRRHQQEAAQQERVLAAARALAIERTRWRILTASPQGGMALVHLAEQLQPLEQASSAARAAADAAQAAYQAALDAFLERLDALQDARDAILRAQTRVDELAAVADALTDTMPASERAQHQQAARDLPQARLELTQLREGEPAIARAMIAARERRDALRPERDRTAAALDACEERERELRVQIEIEKRAVPLALLQLDEQAATLALTEAERRRDQGRIAAAAGALAKVDLEALETDAAGKRDQLEIIRQKIVIALRPTTPEALAEAKARLARAQAASDGAAAAGARDLAIADQEIELAEANVDKLEHAISSRIGRFPDLIADAIRFTRKELDEIGSDDPQEQAALATELRTLEGQLAEAQRHPPNIITAPCSGVCRLRRQDDRAKQAGDRLAEEDVALDLLPPTDLEVLAHVNAASIDRIQVGMPATISIPALGLTGLRATITEVAHVGRDLSQIRPGPFADVTAFDVRARLQEAVPTARQGMGVLLSVELDRARDCLWLPLGAVEAHADGWRAWTGDPRHPQAVTVLGRPFGVDAFIVAGGLTYGQVVYVPRAEPP